MTTGYPKFTSKYPASRQEEAMNFKGSLQMLILNVLAQGPNHGYQIAQHIKQRSGGVLDFKEGTLYPTLHALQRQGLLEAVEAQENGRTRRDYHLTESGRQALATEVRDWRQFVRAVDRNLEDREI
jgi:PadR family transcriptional regulator PadR